MSHSEQFWPFFLCFGLGSLIIVSNLALGVHLKFPDMSPEPGRCRQVLIINNRDFETSSICFLSAVYKKVMWLDKLRYKGSLTREPKRKSC